MLFPTGKLRCLAVPVLLFPVLLLRSSGRGKANTSRAIFFVSLSVLLAALHTSPNFFRPPRPKRIRSRVRYQSGPSRTYEHALRLANVDNAIPQIPRGECCRMGMGSAYRFMAASA